MSQRRKQDGFIMQAGILAAAGIIVHIIGVLYRSPLTSIIGDEGNGYYSMAYNIYAIILLVSSYSIPSAISKVIAPKLALREYRNAHRIFQCAVIYVVVVGGAASLFTVIFADMLVDKNAVPVLRAFAPTIFFSGLLGVLRGYFQAHRTMVHTSVSQILEQIFNAMISILAAWFLIHTVTLGDATTRSVQGAIGGAMGTGAGVVMALLFMFGLYRLNRGFFTRRMRRDTTQEILSRREIFKMIILVVMPFILSTFIYNFSTSLNQTIYVKILCGVKGMGSPEAATMYGIFAGKAVVIVNIPIAIASAVSSAVLPTISGTYAQHDEKETRSKVAMAVRVTMLVSIPAAVGLAVLAQPIMQLLFPQPDSLAAAASLLRALSITVVFYGLSTLTNAVLQGIGMVNRPVIHAAISLTVQSAVLIPLLLLTNWNQYCLVIAGIVYSFVMCVLNQISVRKNLKYRQEWLGTFLMPALSAAVMGVAAWGSYEIFHAIVRSNVISLAFSIVIAMLVYFALVMKTGAMGIEELQQFPKGHLLIRLGRQMRLLS